MPTTTSTVTVIIPTYNRSGYLLEALESVLAQEYMPLRILVSDNASTDDTESVMAAQTDPRIEYIRLPENIGWLGNFNQALDRVDSDYVTLLGDDDRMLPGAITRAVEVLERNPSVGVVHTSFRVINERSELVAERMDQTEGMSGSEIESGDTFIRRSLRYGCRVCAPSTVIRRTALPPAPFDPRDHYAADYGLWLRIALHWDMAYITEPGIECRWHAGQDSNSLLRRPGSNTGIVFFVKHVKDYFADYIEMRRRTRRVKNRFLAENATEFGSDLPALLRLTHKGSGTALLRHMQRTLLERRTKEATLREARREAQRRTTQPRATDSSPSNPEMNS